MTQKALGRTKIVQNELESVERLSSEKWTLIQLTRKETLVKDQKIQQLEGELAIKNDNTNRLLKKLDEFDRVMQEMVVANKILKERIFELEQAMNTCAIRMGSLAGLQSAGESFQSIDTNQMMQDLRRLDKVNCSQSSNSQHNMYSFSQSGKSQIQPWSFQINTLQDIITALEKGWHEFQEKIKMKNKLIQQQKEENKLLREQLNSSQKDESRTKTQCATMQKLLSEAEVSKNKLSQQMSESINRACKNAKIDTEHVPVAELRKNVCVLVVQVEQLRMKTQKLQQELYISKEQCASSLESMATSTAKVKQAKQAQLRTKQREIDQLKSLLNKK